MNKAYGEYRQKKSNEELNDRLDEMREEGFSEEEIGIILANENALAEKAHRDNKVLNLLDSLEAGIGGIFVSMGRGLCQAGSSIAGAIEKAGKAAWDGLKNFGESMSNLASYGEFADNDELYRMKLARYNELMKNPVMLAGDSDSMSDIALFNPDANAAVLAENRAKEMSAIEKDFGITSANAEWLQYKQDLEDQGITVTETEKINVNKGYEELPQLRNNTNAEKLLMNLAKEHNVGYDEMVDSVLAANGVDSIKDLQKMIVNGQQLRAFEGQGWETGMQSKYYADYDNMLDNIQERDHELNELDDQINKIAIETADLMKERNEHVEVINRTYGGYWMEELVLPGDMCKSLIDWASEERNPNPFMRLGKSAIALLAMLPASGIDTAIGYTKIGSREREADRLYNKILRKQKKMDFLKKRRIDVKNKYLK